MTPIILIREESMIPSVLLAQIYIRPKISWHKAITIRRSLDFLVVALVLWVVTQVLVTFAG